MNKKKHLYNKVNSEELKLALANEPFERITVSFYKYIDISVPNELRDELYEVWNKMGVFGRVYIADEGINAQVSIPQPNWEIFKKSVLSNDLFRGIIIKKAIQEGSSFYKLKIKVRKELVAYDVPKESYDMRKVGKHLTASDYNLAIESKDSTVVDMRNYYESEIGRFENAIIPDVETSKELLPEVKKILKGKENEKISFPLFSKLKSISDSSLSPISDTRRKLSELDRNHEKIIRRLREKLSKYFKPGELKSHAIDFSLRFTEPVMKALKIPESRKKDIKSYGRQSPIGSWISFYILITILVMFLIWLPIAESDNFEFKKVLQVSNVLLTLSIFILMAFSLNLHTGYTGMVNFGIIFFVSIGAITVSILTAPERVFGYNWGIMEATIVAMILSAAIGWLLAYPTARLRTDYFAIVTISLGEIVRVLLAGEPLLRAGPVASAIGISGYPLPLEDWWFCGSEKSGPDTQWASPDACRDDILLDSTPAYYIGELLNLGEPAPYMMMLMLLSVASVIVVWALLSRLLSSPWGRVLKAIREDEEVAQHHGHDILTHKAASLALGAAIAALAGALWAWKLTGFDASFMSPARSTFLVWAAFIIGGTSNNRGMIVGAFIIVLMEFVFNVLVAAQGSSDLPLHVTADRIDTLFEWILTNQWDVATIFAITALVGYITRSERVFDIGFSGAVVFLFAALALGERSINESFFAGVVSADMVYIKLMLIGCLMLFSLKFNSKGLLPEVPIRPSRPDGGE